jgi:hypothetical protein
VAVPNVRIERLCWLAVRERLARGGRDNPVLAVFRVRSGARNPIYDRPGMPARDSLGFDLTSGRMASFGFAVYDVAQELSVEERQVLRRTGAVPDWFLPAVYRRRRELRRLGDRGRIWTGQLLEEGLREVEDGTVGGHHR